MCCWDRVCLACLRPCTGASGPLPVNALDNEGLSVSDKDNTTHSLTKAYFHAQSFSSFLLHYHLFHLFPTSYLLFFSFSLFIYFYCSVLLSLSLSQLSHTHSCTDTHTLPLCFCVRESVGDDERRESKKRPNVIPNRATRVKNDTDTRRMQPRHEMRKR